ncbi:MAG: hypothetical protein H3C51_05755 [Rubellimicrobium sp.]|nr:hypothetical protein [Rubellimicrobium sp.]
MSRIRKLAVAAGTFSLALGVGFVMQNGDVLAARFGAMSPAGGPAPAPSVVRGPVAAPQEPALAAAFPRAPDARAGHDDTGALAIALPSDALDPLPALVLDDSGADAAGPVLAALTVDETPAPDPGPQVLAEDSCRSVMAAEALPAGLVNLHLSSPCAPLAQVSFLHQGMMFTEVTDGDGAIDLVVPALATNAMFLADVTGAPGAVALVEVPEVATLDRAVLQWQGADGLTLRALEFGADYGSDGDVWAGAPHAPGAEGTGFLIELGDPALTASQLAQVYTFPHDGSRSGEVALSVEVEVTADNCGRDIAAQSLQIAPGTDIVAHDLTLRVPGCEVAGDLLVVSGMLQDLHLAAN